MYVKSSGVVLSVLSDFPATLVFPRDTMQLGMRCSAVSNVEKSDQSSGEKSPH